MKKGMAKCVEKSLKLPQIQGAYSCHPKKIDQTWPYSGLDGSYVFKLVKLWFIRSLIKVALLKRKRKLSKNVEDVLSNKSVKWPWLLRRPYVVNCYVGFNEKEKLFFHRIIKFCCKMCCIFWPAFGCCALQMLDKICSNTFFACFYNFLRQKFWKWSKK